VSQSMKFVFLMAMMWRVLCAGMWCYAVW